MQELLHVGNDFDLFVNSVRDFTANPTQRWQLGPLRHLVKLPVPETPEMSSLNFSSSECWRIPATKRLIRFLPLDSLAELHAVKFFYFLPLNDVNVLDLVKNQLVHNVQGTLVYAHSFSAGASPISRVVRDATRQLDATLGFLDPRHRLILQLVLKVASFQNPLLPRLNIVNHGQLKLREETPVEAHDIFHHLFWHLDLVGGHLHCLR